VKHLEAFWKAETTTKVRALVALFVLAVTWWLTHLGVSIGSQWQAVFIVVIGYYFKDRPAEDRATLSSTPDSGHAEGELLWQFLLALLLVVGTFETFLKAKNESDVPAVWVGGAVLAVAFYFKETNQQQLQSLHEKSRAILAVLVTGLTIFLLPRSKPANGFNLPLQWIGLVLLVVAFYFKEQARPEGGPAAGAGAVAGGGAASAAAGGTSGGPATGGLPSPAPAAPMAGDDDTSYGKNPGS
jgi:hypothetical protein